MKALSGASTCPYRFGNPWTAQLLGQSFLIILLLELFQNSLFVEAMFDTAYFLTAFLLILGLNRSPGRMEDHQTIGGWLVEVPRECQATVYVSAVTVNKILNIKAALTICPALWSPFCALGGFQSVAEPGFKPRQSNARVYAVSL